jgi:hypothetical protein
MATTARVSKLPKCDFNHADTDPLSKRAARYDGKTRMGPWAFMCEAHYRQHGVGLGTGQGQKLMLEFDKKEDTQ